MAGSPGRSGRKCGCSHSRTSDPSTVTSSGSDRPEGGGDVFAFGEIERVERAINAVKTAIIDEHNYQLWQYEQEIWKHDHRD